jgi:hypothetical protein
MRMIRPKLKTKQISIAEDQQEYKPVTGALVRNPLYEATPKMVGDVPLGEPFNTVVMAYVPSDIERIQIARGEPIYLHLLTFGGPLQPHILSVGTEATAAMYGVEVEE